MFPNHFTHAAPLQELTPVQMSRKRPLTEWPAGENQPMMSTIGYENNNHLNPMMDYGMSHMQYPQMYNFGEFPSQHYQMQQFPMNVGYGIPPQPNIQDENADRIPIQKIDIRHVNQEGDNGQVLGSGSESPSTIELGRPSVTPSFRMKNGSNTVVECLVCKEENTPKMLNENHLYHILCHLAHHEQSIRRFECDGCGFACMRKDKMSAHVAKVAQCAKARTFLRKNPTYLGTVSQVVNKCFPSLHDRILKYCQDDNAGATRRRSTVSAVHTAECQLCGSKVRTTGGSRDYHARTHSGKFRYCCSVCGKEAHLKDNLRVHIARNHLGNATCIDRETPELKVEYKKCLDECFPR